MKKTLFIALLLMACSSSNDGTANEGDPILGKWSFGKTAYLLDGATVHEEPPSFCDALTSYTFKPDGNIALVSFLDNSSGGCEPETVDLSVFTWEKVGTNSYRLYSVGDSGTPHTRIEAVHFESGNVMYWVDVFEGTTEDGDGFNERRSYFNKN